jgi:hypothetical protein
MRFIFDSDLNRKHKNIQSSFPLHPENYSVPAGMVKKFRIDAMDESGWCV